MTYAFDVTNALRDSVTPATRTGRIVHDTLGVRDWNVRRKFAMALAVAQAKGWLGRGSTWLVLWCLLAASLTCVEPHTTGPAFTLSNVAHGRTWPSLDRTIGNGKMAVVGQRGLCSAVRPESMTLRMAVNYEPGDKVIAKDQAGTLTEFVKSWWTVELDDGGTVKSRAKDLAPLSGGGAPTAAPASAAKKGTGTTTRKGTGTAKRTPPAAKAAAKPATALAPTSPPKKAKISPALERVLSQPTGASKSDDSGSVAPYPAALANIFDDTESGSGAKPGAGKAAAKYPAGLSHVLNPKVDISSDENVAAYPAALAQVFDISDGDIGKKGNKKPAATSVTYPAGLARVLKGSQQNSTARSPSDGGVARYPEALSKILTTQRGAPKKKVAMKTAAPTKTSASKISARKKGGKGGVQYPGALQRYLDLSAAVPALQPAAAPPKKPKRAAYPAVLANVLALTASTSTAKTKARSTEGTTTNFRRKMLSRTTTLKKSRSAKYPAVLAQLLEAAKNTGRNAELAADATFLTKYPAALAAYFDFAEISKVPPSVAPPKRAA